MALVFRFFLHFFAFLPLHLLYVVSTKFQTLGIGTKALATSDFPLVLKLYNCVVHILYKTGRGGNPSLGIRQCT